MEAGVQLNWANGLWTLPLPAHLTHAPSGKMLPLEALDTGGGLPRLPTGVRLQLEERDVSDDGGFGGTVWRAASALCRWQLSEVEQIQGARILELGAGTGAVGLFAAALGARQVVLTDGEEALLPLLHRNALQNRPFVRGEMLFGQWRFGDLPRFPMPEGLEGDKNYFEFVMGSDITYSVKSERNSLCHTLRQLLRSGTAKRCILSHEHRRSDMFDIETIMRDMLPSTIAEKDEALQIFLSAAADHDLLVTPIVTEWGRRGQGHGKVGLTSDLSIFEVSWVGNQ